MARTIRFSRQNLTQAMMQALEPHRSRLANVNHVTIVARGDTITVTANPGAKHDAEAFVEGQLRAVMPQLGFQLH